MGSFVGNMGLFCICVSTNFQVHLVHPPIVVIHFLPREHYIHIIYINANTSVFTYTVEIGNSTSNKTELALAHYIITVTGNGSLLMLVGEIWQCVSCRRSAAHLCCYPMTRHIRSKLLLQPDAWQEMNNNVTDSHTAGTCILDFAALHMKLHTYKRN